MKAVYLLLTILFFAFSVFAQADLPIIGKISDIQSKKKIYLLAETTESRTEMQKVMEKDKFFEIVGDPSTAEFIIEFKAISKKQPVSLGVGTFQQLDEMTAYFYNSDKKKVIAWSKTRDYYKQGWGMPKKNENLLAADFLKAYKGKK